MSIEVHHIVDIINIFTNNNFFDSDGIDIFFPLHLQIQIPKIIGVCHQINSFIFGWQSVPYKSSWYFAHLKFHYFLEIDVTEIVDDPFYFDVIDVYSGGHVEVVHYFVGHEVDVFLWGLEHQFMHNLVGGVGIGVIFIVFAFGVEQGHYLCFCSFVNFLKNAVRGESVGGVVNSFGLQFVFDVALYVNNGFLQFMQRSQHEHLEFDLVEKLAISIGILNNAKRLGVVHFVFLDLLDLEFFIFMQNKFFKLRYIVLQNFHVPHSFVEMRGDKFLEVVKVHEIWVDAFQHFLVEV